MPLWLPYFRLGLGILYVPDYAGNPGANREVGGSTTFERSIHMAHTVIVYTQTTCGPCQEEKMWLTSHNIAFEDRDIRKNDAYFQEAINLGASMTPVTFIEKENGEQIVIHGFDKEELKKALDLS
ncbi:glutaredoxin family protein [Brevibacillus sp. SAFN-007a]|uniref:glutaredoxin family protein n=1 Tax=Brevibacillus sp. SAFN-007a TaxID=3436862 RepID=UPI003F7DD13B